MKILFLTHYSDLYGANRSLLALIDGLRAYEPQFDVRIIIPQPGRIEEELKLRMVPYKIIPMHSWIRYAHFSKNRYYRVYQRLSSLKAVTIKLLSRVKSTLAVQRAVRADNIDLVYSNSSVILEGFLGAKLAGVKHVWHLREFIDKDYSHAPDFGWSIFKRILKQSDFLILISKAIEQHFGLNNFPARKVIYNGVLKFADFERLRVLKKERNASTFLLIGLIQYSKGHETAIEAIARLKDANPSVKLLVIGEGDEAYLAKLQEMIKTLGIKEHVEFLGYKDDVYPFLLSATALLMCSHAEALGRITIEAQAALCPVIGLNDGGTSELIQHGKNGLLYDGSAGQLAACMQHVMDDPIRSNEMATYAAEMARDNFSIETYASQVADVLMRFDHPHKTSNT